MPLFTPTGHCPQIYEIVRAGEKGILTPVSPLGYVMGQTRNYDSWQSGHGVSS